MIDPTAAEAALSEVRDLVAADGGDITVHSVTDRSVELTLILDTVECAECVMPRSFLETVALDMMKPSLPGLAEVRIHDPRESGSTR